MKSSTNRRDILRASVAAGIASLIAPITGNSVSSYINSESPLPPAKKAYISKHGHEIKDSYYLWSVLTIKNESKFLTDINAILTSHKYYSRVSFSQNDKFLVPVAKSIIDYVMSPTSGVTFNMNYYSSNPSTFKNISPHQNNLRKNTLYSKLISGFSGYSLIGKTEDRFGPSSDYLSKFSQTHGMDLTPVNVLSDKILQVNDLISGICYSIIVGKQLQSSTRIAIRSYFDSKVQLSSKKNQNVINVVGIQIKKTIV